jgi:hypothetical protein
LIVIIAVVVGIPVVGVIMATLTTNGHFVSEMMSGAGVSSTGSTSVQTAIAPAGPAKTTSSFAQEPMLDNGMMLRQDFTIGDSQLVVRSANLSLEVTNIQKSVDQISSIVKNAQGFVTSSNLFQSSYVMMRNSRNYQNQTQSATLVLRVPAAKLDDTIAQISQVGGRVLQQNISSDDRTAQQVSLDSRLKNLQVTQTQLQNIMKQAKTVQETMAVQQQLNSVESQIEQITSQRQGLTTDAAMATITVSLSLSPESLISANSARQLSFIDEMKLSLSQAKEMYRRLFIAGLRLLTFTAPLLIIAAVAWFIWQRKARKV